MTTFCIC